MAAAAGNAAAPWDIGNILEYGYSYGVRQPDGQIKVMDVSAKPARGDPLVRGFQRAAAIRRRRSTFAYYYGLGEEIFKRSGIQKDQGKALDLLNQAANDKDTHALAILFDLYSHQPPVMEGAINIVTLPHDPGDKAKWMQSLKSWSETMSSNAAVCKSPETKAQMVAAFSGQTASGHGQGCRSVDSRLSG